MTSNDPDFGTAESRERSMPAHVKAAHLAQLEHLIEVHRRRAIVWRFAVAVAVIAAIALAGDYSKSVEQVVHCHGGDGVTLQLKLPADSRVSAQQGCSTFIREHAARVPGGGSWTPVGGDHTVTASVATTVCEASDERRDVWPSPHECH